MVLHQRTAFQPLRLPTLLSRTPYATPLHSLPAPPPGLRYVALARTLEMVDDLLTRPQFDCPLARSTPTPSPALDRTRGMSRGKKKSPPVAR